MSPSEKILDKLSKLKAAQEGEAKLGNSAASEAFAEAISRLLLQHELSEADIPIGGVKDEPIVEQLVDLAQFGIKFSRVRLGWQEALARIVAPAHLCKFLVTSGTNNITFVGTRQHVIVAEYAYGTLAAAADRLSFQAREDYWRDECGGQHLKSNGFRASWLTGFISRIGERFREAQKKEVAAAANTSTALMRLNQALVRAQQHVDEKIQEDDSACSGRRREHVGVSRWTVCGGLGEDGAEGCRRFVRQKEVNIMEGLKIVGIELTAAAFDRIIQTAIDAGHNFGFGYWAEVDGVERNGDIITTITLHEYEEEGGLKKTLRNADIQVALMLAIDAGERLDDDAIDGPWCERVLQYAMFGKVKYS